MLIARSKTRRFSCDWAYIIYIIQNASPTSRAYLLITEDFNICLQISLLSSIIFSASERFKPLVIIKGTLFPVRILSFTDNPKIAFYVQTI